MRISLFLPAMLYWQIAPTCVVNTSRQCLAFYVIVPNQSWSIGIGLEAFALHVYLHNIIGIHEVTVVFTCVYNDATYHNNSWAEFIPYPTVCYEGWSWSCHGALNGHGNTKSANPLKPCNSIIRNGSQSVLRLSTQCNSDVRVETPYVIVTSVRV